MIVETRWATINDVVVAVSGASADRRRASVLRSRAENESSNRKIPGDRQALALATGHVRAALADLGVELAGHRLDEVPRLRDLERLPQLLVGGVRIGVPQVARHGAGEEIGLLGNETDATPQHLGLEV